MHCKDYRRRERHEQVKFDFLGFSFQPGQAQSSLTPGTSFTAYTARISRENQKKIRGIIRDGINWRNTTLELTDIAEKLNHKLRGWINYFGCHGKRGLRDSLLFLDMKLTSWLMRKHRISYRKAILLLREFHNSKPNRFYHWYAGYCFNVNKITRAV